MTLSTIAQLRDHGARYAEAGNPKPDFAAWTLTYGAGPGSGNAHRAFCQGFDAARREAWATVKRSRPPRATALSWRVAVPA